ncbi:MAG: restriction endonuclease subunit S [Pseudonocardiaceae bacterium]|nr:restriction endonuclease subunit S [Pseudonocardiaceae bacterium]
MIEVVRLRHVADVNPPSPRFDRLSSDAELTFLPMEAVWPGEHMDRGRVRVKSSVETGFTRFQDGDVLVPKITPTFEASRSVLVNGLINGAGAGTTELHVLRPRSECDGRYLTYVTHSHPFLKLGESQMYGVAGQQRVPDDFVRDYPLRLPPLEEQRRIADFLNAQSRRIDLLIRLRIKQNALLDSEQVACIDTELLTPGSSRARVKYLTSRITSGPRGWGELIAESGTPFVRITNIARNGIKLLLRDLLRVQAPSGAERKRTRTKIGDVLVSITADIGSVGVVDADTADGNVSQHVALLRPDPRACLPVWLAYAMHSSPVRDSLRTSSYGGTKVGLSLSDVSNMRIPVPTLRDQESAVARLDKALSDIENLRSGLEEQVRLLFERRQALITAAVTGQIDVTTTRGADM